MNNSSLLKALYRFSYSLVLTALVANNVASATTLVRIQTTTDNVSVSEGYQLSVEDWSEQTRTHRGQAGESRQTPDPLSHDADAIDSDSNANANLNTSTSNGNGNGNGTSTNIALTNNAVINSDTDAAESTTTQSLRFHNTYRPPVWITRIGNLLFDDRDRDGFHSGFSLSIDVDSDYGDTDVFASIYLLGENGQSSLLHTTSRFSVYGTLRGDEYRVDTELRNNFEADYYNVTVDIHDAWTGQVLDTANARSFSNLGGLPLEAASTDTSTLLSHPGHSAVASAQNVGTADVVVTEFAGSLSPVFALLGALLGILVFLKNRLDRRAGETLTDQALQHSCKQ